jgi:hypothetical protein
MKRIQLILFLFAILLEISQSMSPKKNIYELPIIPINQTKSRKSKIIPQKNYTFANSKYFAFNLRDIRTINNFMFFQINSTGRSKSFSYALLRDPIEKLNRPNTFEFQNKWYKPNITHSNPYYNKISYQIGIYGIIKDITKKSIVIKVSPGSLNENITCENLFNVSQSLKGQTIILEHKMNQEKEKRREIDILNNRPYSDRKMNDNHRKYKKLLKHWKNNPKHYFKGCLAIIIISSVLISIWSCLAILYCLTNRRKGSFVGDLKNQQQIILNNYQSI